MKCSLRRRLQSGCAANWEIDPENHCPPPADFTADISLPADLIPVNVEPNPYGQIFCGRGTVVPMPPYSLLPRLPGFW